MKKRYRMLAQGRVQGVGFWGTCAMYARQFNLTGSVENLETGDVEIYVQGEAIDIERFKAAIQSENRWIRIDHLIEEQLPLDPDERRFEYKFY